MSNMKKVALLILFTTLTLALTFGVAIKREDGSTAFYCVSKPEGVSAWQILWELPIGFEYARYSFGIGICKLRKDEKKVEVSTSDCALTVTIWVDNFLSGLGVSDLKTGEKNTSPCDMCSWVSGPCDGCAYSIWQGSVLKLVDGSSWGGNMSASFSRICPRPGRKKRLRMVIRQGNRIVRPYWNEKLEFYEGQDINIILPKDFKGKAIIGNLKWKKTFQVDGNFNIKLEKGEYLLKLLSDEYAMLKLRIEVKERKRIRAGSLGQMVEGGEQVIWMDYKGNGMYEVLKGQEVVERGKFRCGVFKLKLEAGEYLVRIFPEDPSIYAEVPLKIKKVFKVKFWYSKDWIKLKVIDERPLQGVFVYLNDKLVGVTNSEGEIELFGSGKVRIEREGYMPLSLLFQRV